MIRSFVSNTQLGLAVGFIAVLAGSIALMALVYAQDQYGGDIVMSAGFLTTIVFGWLIGRLYRTAHWPLAAFAAAGAVFIYTEIVRAFLDYYRVGVLGWNSSLFSSFSMVVTLESMLAQTLAAIVAIIAALVGRSRHSLQEAAPAPPKPRSRRDFLLSGAGLVAVVAAVAILVALVELFAFHTSLEAGQAIGWVWLLTVGALAWRLGQFHARTSAVLACASATGLAHWLFSAHETYLVDVWYSGLDRDFVDTLGGAGLFNHIGLWFLAGACGVLASAAAFLRNETVPASP